jgi:hypothetical protein
MKTLYVVGGRQGKPVPLLAGNQRWYKYDRALINWVDPSTGRVELRAEHTTPEEWCEDEDPAILFKCSSVQGDRLYACTETEVLIYALPSFERLSYFSLPAFHDLHHIRATPDGTIVVANTGLDMVMELTTDGRMVREWSAKDGEDPWLRYSRDRDYRRVRETGSSCHINYLFYLDGELWATRFQQKDAVCISRPGSGRIDIGIAIPHDGFLHEGMLYFTTVDGHVVIANAETFKVEEVVNLGDLHGRARLGWCRGLYVEGDRVWVGFTRMRATKFRENVAWVKHGFSKMMPTHIGCYDFKRRLCLTEIDMEEHGMGAVFSILPCETVDEAQEPSWTGLEPADASVV